MFKFYKVYMYSINNPISIQWLSSEEATMPRNSNISDQSHESKIKKSKTYRNLKIEHKEFFDWNPKGSMTVSIFKLQNLLWRKLGHYLIHLSFFTIKLEVTLPFILLLYSVLNKSEQCVNINNTILKTYEWFIILHELN